MATRSKTAGPLQRGLACLSCRKKKLKCDGTRPVCRQCVKMNRHEECQYDNKRQESRTQKLREKLSMLEERLRELESDHTGSESSPSISDGFLSHARSHSVDISTSATFELDQHFSASKAGSSYLANSENLAPTNLITLENSDSPAGPWGPSLMPSPSGSTYMPLYVDETGNSFSGNDYGAAPFPGSSLGIPSSHVPSASSSQTPSSVQDIISSQNKRLLLDIFAVHRDQFGFYSHLDRFRVPFQGPPNKEPHPALMNAIYLLACYFSELKWTSELEPDLLSRALCDITDALDQSDRLVDIVQASCLISVYLYANQRILEGYCHAFQAAKLAVSLGLHQIAADLHEHQPHRPGTLEQVIPTSRSLPPPRDLMELDERIAAFWQVFMLDRCWSVANGLPRALSPNRLYFRITTPWPQPITEPLFHGEGDDQDTIRDLYIQNPNMPTTTFPPALRAKAAVLYEHTFRLTSVTPKNDAYWTERRSVAAAVQQFAATIPAFVGYEAWRSQPPRVDVSLLAVHMMVHVAHLNLQKDAHETLRTATVAVALIRQLNDGDYKYLDPILSSCWYGVAKVYIRILGTVGHNTHEGMSAGLRNAIEQELDVLTNALQALSKYFLFAGDYAKRLKQERVKVHITNSQ